MVLMPRCPSCGTAVPPEDGGAMLYSSGADCVLDSQDGWAGELEMKFPRRMTVSRCQEVKPASVRSLENRSKGAGDCKREQL